MQTKVCTGCQLEQPLAAYSRDKRAADGLKWKCKTCAAKWYADNRERLNALHADWNAKNKDRISRYNAKRYAENADRWREKTRGYYWQNREEVFSRLKPEQRAEAQARRRASKRRAMPLWDEEFDRLVMTEAARLAVSRGRATGVPHHVDHIVPIRGRTVCGLHNGYNLAVTPAGENQRKSNIRWPDMWV